MVAKRIKLMNVATQLKTTISTYVFETTYNELAYIRSNYHTGSHKYYRTVHKKNHSSSSRGHTLERKKRRRSEYRANNKTIQLERV